MSLNPIEFASKFADISNSHFNNAPDAPEKFDLYRFGLQYTDVVKGTSVELVRNLGETTARIIDARKNVASGESAAAVTNYLYHLAAELHYRMQGKEPMKGGAESWQR